MLFLLIIAKGQTTNPDVGELEPKAKPDTPRLPVQILVEKEASFPGGTNLLFSYIRRNLKYPKESKEKGIEGIVTVSFIVLKDGRLQDIKVEKSVSPELDAEALRLISVSPVWDPAIQYGKAVSQSFKVPVTFKLN